MSHSAQKMRPPKAQSSNWTLTFPKEQVTVQQSSLFMKKLLALAISNITYLRAIFPEKAFGNRHLGDLNLKILSEDSVCPAACQVIEWVKGCFEALDKKYLRQMMIGIYTNPEEPDNVIEAYTFRITYNKEGTTVTCNGEKVATTSPCCSDLTRKNTVSLLRTIFILTQSLDPLPRNAYMSMKLLYYDEVTPPDYEPKGFRPAETDNFFFKNEPVNLRFGDVSTPYHCLKVRIKTDKNQFEILDEEPIPSGSMPIEESSKTDKTENSQTSLNNPEMKDKTNAEVETQQNGNYTLNTTPSCSVPDKNPHIKEDANGHIEKVKADDNTVRCPCGFLEDDGLMISCINCETWQHAVCFGILEESETPSSHTCTGCYEKNMQDFEPTDMELLNLPAVELQALCLWRRALMSCSYLKTVTVNSLSKRLRVEKCVASSILERLEEEGYISNGTGKYKRTKIVNKKLIDSVGIAKYIKRKSKENVSDNQIDELASKTEVITIDEPELEPTGYRLRGRKRAVGSNSEENPDFEINTSQEITMDSEDGKRKRIKASSSVTGIQFQ